MVRKIGSHYLSSIFLYRDLHDSPCDIGYIVRLVQLPEEEI